ncbi:unnamed protein product [Caenorhabditis auriculariae]|uniref:CUB domain-containing protein n=1 Tax=Caenorhabditis auriculariae TaxID=2777116 RepID=A0A8S1HQG5_9PELO|nr:unnamed protein product [Caenorhabditis auriculariae]
MRLVLGIALLVSVRAADLCGNGFTFSDKTSYCYSLSNGVMTWPEAVIYCTNLGGYLADISGGPELVEFGNLYGSSLMTPWVGAFLNTTSGKWQFLNGGSVFLSYWTTNEPSAYGNRASLRGLPKTGLKATPEYSVQPALCKEKPALCNGGNFGGLNVGSGNITSPGWPVQYYNNLNCVYYITGPLNTYITIFFDPYLVENFVDYVEVFNGISTNPKDRLGWIDDKNTWDVSFEAKANTMTVVFHSDATQTDRGWVAKWNAKYNVPPVYSNGSSGELSSPNYPNDYDPFTQQLYYIDVFSPLNVNITFDAFNTQLKLDYLEVYSSRQYSSANLVANYTGSTVAPTSLLVQSSSVTLRFVTDGEVQRPGWHLFWNVV